MEGPRSQGDESERGHARVDVQLHVAIVAAVVGAVAATLAEWLVGADPGVFSLTVGILALAYPAVVIGFRRRRSRIKLPHGMAYQIFCFPRRWRLAAYAYLLAALAGTPWLGAYVYLYASAAVRFRTLDPPELTLAVQHRSVALGKESRVAVLVDGRIAPDEYSCVWSPERFMSPAAPDCATTFAPTPEALARSERQAKVRISVAVRKDERKVASRSTSVSVVYAPVVTIEARVAPRRDLTDDIFAGDTVTVSAHLNGRVVPSGHTCAWTVGKLPFPSRRCDIELLAPPIHDRKRTTRLDLSVLLLDRSRKRVGEPVREILTVHRPRANYTVFVLEAARRERAPAPIELARPDLLDRLHRIHAVTGHVGVEVFGAAKPRVAKSECLNAVPLFPLVPLNLPKLEQRLATVAPGGPAAPVQLALGRGLASLARARAQDPEGSTRLVAILGGPDNCRGEGLSDFLEAWREQIDTAGLQGSWFRFEFLTLAVIVDYTGEIRAAWRDPKVQSRYSDTAFVVLFVFGRSELASIIDAVARLGDPEARARLAACRELARLARRAEGSRSARRVERYCARVY